MWIKITDSATGNYEDLNVELFYPLKTSDLLKNNTKSFNIKAKITKNDYNPSKANQTVHVPLDFHENLTVFSLVDNGWLPAPFTIPPTFLIDRNILSTFEGSQKGKAHYSENSWWFNPFHKSNKDSLEINVIFSALEGDKRKLPEFDIFLKNIEECSQIVTKQFKNVIVSELTNFQLKIIYDFLTKNYNDFIGFLMEVSPFIYQSVSYKNKNSILDKIFNLAKKYKLKEHSHILLLAIACLYESPASNSRKKFARKILKPKENYSMEIAHNCIFDVLFIDLLLLLKHYANTNYSGLSADKPLSIYWTIINPKLSLQQSDFTYTLEIKHELFESASTSDHQNIIARLKAL
ncbi:hypothetical protein RT723_10085 [Psychrosphaera aquimarina]|uniref:Uncharacterized protein n=1 Tax=Psychrosphaera aquimarina TaxID=2044854 RepID=A0ABU3R1I4_9GAMM|nr:hypothetical protein [Psychrosphaera aquimarina]MDU0113337.1 hypothetical protein [Psychrosphaera aquimarina]